MKANRLIVLIMAAVVVWGAFLSVGAWRQSHDWRRPAITMGCVFAFLLFWAVMLLRHKPDSENP